MEKPWRKRTRHIIARPIGRQQIVEEREAMRAEEEEEEEEEEEATSKARQ